VLISNCTTNSGCTNRICRKPLAGLSNARHGGAPGRLCRAKETLPPTKQLTMKVVGHFRGLSKAES